MRHLYSILSRTLVISCLLFMGKARAQSPTTVSASSSCSVVQNFNTTNGNFTAPSIYSDQYDYEFDWSGAGASGALVSSSAATLAPYETSLISPIYVNTAITGTTNVGFSYAAPAGTLYRIRVIRPNIATGGVDVLAITSQGPPVIGGVNNWAALPSTSGTLCLKLTDADLVAGQNLRYEFTFYVTSTASRVTFDNFSLSDVAASPLPVTFLGIVATRDHSAVNLKWDVAAESDVLEYRVERSTDGSSFTTAGVLSATQKPIYNYSDVNVGSGTVYYRLKSVDLSGSSKYSPIIKLVEGSSYTKGIKAYPTPAQNQLTLQHSQLGGKARITLSTMDGRIVKLVTPSNGASNTVVDITGLSSGMYLVRLDNGQGKIETTTFVKQ